MRQTTLTKKLEWLPIRWLTALLGLVLLIVGQIQVADNEIPLTPATKLGKWLTNQVHLSIPTIDNVLHGLPFLLIGAALLFVSMRGLKFLHSEEPISKGDPVSSKQSRLLWFWLAAGTGLFILLLWQLNSLDYNSLWVVQWLLALFLFTIASAIWDHHRQVHISPGVSRTDTLWMLGLFIISLIVGAYRLQGLPDMLMGDEGSFWTAARDIATGSFKPPIFANGVYTFPVLSSIGQAWGLKLFGIDLWGWRFGSVLAGSLTIFPLYLLGRDAFDRKVGIASCIALIFSPYFLAFARLGYNNIQSLFITTLALYWLFIGSRRSSVFYLFLAGCAVGFGFYTYFAARMTIVIAMLFILTLWLGRKINFRHAALALLVLLIGAILVVSPYIIYGMRSDTTGMGFKVFESVFFNTFNGLQFYSQEELTKVAPIFKFGGNDLFYNPKIYLVLIARGLIRTLLVFQKPWLNSEHFIAAPLTGTVGVIFYLIGIGAMLKRVRESRNILLLIWFLVTIFGLSIFNTVPPRHTHMVSIIPALALLTGMGINIITNAIASIRKSHPQIKKLFLGLLLTLLAVGGIYDYFILMPRKYHPQPDQIISWAGLYAKDETIIYIYTEESELDIVRPYIILEFHPEVTFKTVSFEQFKTDNQQYANNRNYVFFYMPGLAENIEPVLMQNWGTSLVKRDFYSPDGFPVLSAGMNTPFVFERDRSVLSVVRESYGRLTFLVFIGILFFLFGLVAFIPAIWTSRMPRWVQAFAGWFNAPIRPQEENEDKPEEGQYGSLIQPMSEPEPDEPPDWAVPVFTPQVAGKPEHLKVETRSIRGHNGREFFLHIHFPLLRLPWKSLPEEWRVSVPDLRIPAPVLLVTAVITAIIAQILIYMQNFVLGVICYAVCAASLFAWSRINPKWSLVLGNQVRIPPKAEIIVGIFILAAVIFTRFYDLDYRVYGLEADETKWTVQSWFSTILRVDKGDFAGMHYQYLPVDFWVRSFFLRLFGLNFISARIESAVFSVIAVIFLFLLVRRLTASPPTALLTAAVYSYSFIELNGSHQALHNTTLEPWLMAGLYFLIAGIQSRRWWQFQAAGILLALGMLTYETFFPTVLVALVYLFGTAIYQLSKRRANIHQWLPGLLLTTWPVMVVYFTFTQKYLQARHGYHFGWLDDVLQGDQNINAAVSFFIQNLSELLKTTFSGVIHQDSLLRWEGSFLNQLILPFMVIGLVYNLCNLRRPYYLFIPIWYLFNIAAAPLFLGSVWPRVLYTSLGPLTLWAAMGLWVFFGSLRIWFSQARLHVTLPVFILVLLIILTGDYMIFTRGIMDPIDRVKRRELANFTYASAASTPLLIYPYYPSQNDSVELETHVILFSVAGARHVGLEAEKYFKQVHFDQLLLSLWENRNTDGIDIVFDKAAPALQQSRAQALNVVLRCYPGSSLQESGEFFDVYRFDPATLSQPICYQTLPPTPIAPGDGTEVLPNLPITLQWDNGAVETTGFSVTIDQHIPNVYWIEAEDVFQGNGWYMASEFATDFTGNGFLLDNWQSGEAQYSLDVEQGGEYRVWVRSYKRLINDQQNFIAINGRMIQFAGSENVVDKWVWEFIGTFDLPVGPVLIGLSRAYGQDDQYSVFIDSVLVTPDLINPPASDIVWKTVFASEEHHDSGSQITLIEQLPAGEYRWSVRVFDGDKLIDSFGERGISMPFTGFIVLP